MGHANSPQESTDYKQDVLSLIWFPAELSPFAVYFVVILAIPSRIKIKYLKSSMFLIILRSFYLLVAIIPGNANYC